MANDYSKYDWQTEFVTAENLMVHTFNECVQVETNIKTGVAKVKRFGITVYTVSDLTIKRYEGFLLNIARYAQLVKLGKELNAKAAQLIEKVTQAAKYAMVWAILLVGMFAFVLLTGDNEDWSMWQFLLQKASCFAVIGLCWLAIAATPLKATWRDIEAKIPE